MIQADELLLARARSVARERNISFPQLVRDALEHELGDRAGEPLSATAAGDSGGQAQSRSYQPEAWR
jgi:hypothetical protein